MPETRSAAEGQWIQGCLFDAEDSDYVQKTLLIEENRFTLTQRVYSDAECMNDVQASELSGTFVEGEEIEVAGRGTAREIDLTVDALALSFHTAAQVESANGMALCDATNWSIGVSRDVSNCSQVPGSTVPRQVYDIYLRENGTLFTGIEGGDTQETRPVTLDEAGVYTAATTDNQDGNDNNDQGDNDQNSGNVTLPENSLAITASNGEDVAEFVMAQYYLIKGMTNAGNTGVISAAGNSEGRLTDLYVSSTCEGGGSVSINGTPAVLNTLSARYTDCMIDSVTYNGAMTMMFAAANGPLGDPGADWSYSTGVQLSDFNVTTASRSLSIDGDFVLTGVHMAQTEQSGGFTARFQGIQDEELFLTESNAVTRMIDFDFFFTYLASDPVIFSDSFNEARIASSLIGGQVTVEQSSDFSGFGFMLPDSGELEVFGAENSLLTIDAEDGDNVILSVDANGNGEYTDDADLIMTGSWTGYFSR